VSDSKSSSRDKVRPAAPSPPAKGGARWLLLAAVIIVGLWFGIKALREAPEVGAGDAASVDAGAAPQGPPPATVLVSPVTRQLSQEQRRVTGTLRALARAEVAAREAGAVAEVLIDEGHLVKKGDILAVLDTSRLDAELAEAEARLIAAKSVIIQREAESKRALTDLERKKKLFKSGAVSEREFLDAERESAVAIAGAEVARGQLAAMASSVELMRVRSKDLKILAPFDGRIVARHVEPGEWLAVGNPVATLVSNGKIEAWLSVPERFANTIIEQSKDLDVVSEANGAKSKVVELRQVADIDPVTRLFPVVATIENADDQMVAGMAVTVDLPVGKSAEFLSVAADALIVARNESYVFRPNPGEAQQLPTAEKVPVRELFRSKGRVYVESESLRAGDMVVTEGNERLFPGTPLITAPADAQERIETTPVTAP